MEVKAGDILLFRVIPDSTLLDKLIGWGQNRLGEPRAKGNYCHAAMVGPDAGHIYEARWPRFHNVPIDASDLIKRNVVEVYRIRGITSDQITKMLASAQDHVGEFYDLAAIFTFGMIQLGGTIYCSQAVWRDALAAGIVLWPFEKLESPDDLANSENLEYIGPLFEAAQGK